MPFEIVRNDIAQMRVDAIVNTANPRPVIGSGVDDILCVQTKSGGDGSFSHADSADFLPGGQQLRPRRPMNACVDAAADHRPWVGGIHDGVHPHLGNIVSYNLKGHISHLPILVSV